MSEEIDVVVGAAGAECELRFLHELGRRELGVRVRRRCTEVGELIGVALRDRPDAVIVDGTRPWTDREFVETLRRAGIAVVAVGADPASTAPGVRTVPADADVDAVVDALRDRGSEPVVTAPEPSTVPDRSWGRTIAVWSGSGAPGRTTVAVHLAVEAARAGRRVLLVDGDAGGASIAQLLELEETPSLAQAAHAAEAGWPQPLHAFAQPGPDGLAVVSGLAHPDLWPEVTEPAWRAVLAAAAATFDLVIVDLAAAAEEDEELVVDEVPVRRNLMTTVTLELADSVVLVTLADPVGLRRGIVAHRRLVEHRQPRADTVRVVLNRVPRPGRRVQECSHAIAEWTGAPPVALLPDEPLLTRTVWEGRPLQAFAPRSRWLRELADLVADLDAGAAGAAA